MPSDDCDPEGTVSSYRRRFLQGIGATGIANTLAGCLGGEENGDENGNETENGNGDAPATFEVGGLEPTAVTATQGESTDVTATIENTGDREGTQSVVLTIDDDETDSKELTLGSGESGEVSLEVAAGDLEPGNYEFVASTEDDDAAGTLTVEAFTDLEALFSFDEDPLTLQPGGNTIGGTVNSSYPATIDSGGVSLSVPDGWEVTSESGTDFSGLEANGFQSVEWELGIPDGTIGEFELAVEETQSVGDEEATFSQTLASTVNPPLVLDYNQAVPPSELDSEVTDDRPLAFFCSGIELQDADGERLILYDIGNEPEPPEMEGVYAQEEQPEDEFEKPEDAYKRWFGTEDEQTTIFFDLEHIQDTARIRLRGEPMVDNEITATVNVGSQEITTIDFGVREMTDYIFELDNGGGYAVQSAPYGFNAGGDPSEPQSEVPVVKDDLEFHSELGGAVEVYGDADASSTDTEVGTYEVADAIEGTDYDALYQTEHFGGDLSYDVHIENGTYDITFHWAEQNESLGTGDRVFDVAAQDETVLEEYDIAEAVGTFTAATETIEGVEVTDGLLQITTETRSNNSKFCAVEIREAGDDDTDAEFEEVLHFEDHFAGPEERCMEGGEPACGAEEYEVDLSAYAEHGVVQVRFEDAYPEDGGWGPIVHEMSVSADGEQVHAFNVPSEGEDEYMVEDQSTDSVSDDRRWADAGDYWIYQFDLPADADTVTATITMANAFRILARPVESGT